MFTPEEQLKHAEMVKRIDAAHYDAIIKELSLQGEVRRLTVSGYEKLLEQVEERRTQ